MSTFTKSPEDYAGGHIFQGKDSVKTNDSKYQYALFHILFDHWKKYFDDQDNIDAFFLKV